MECLMSQEALAQRLGVAYGTVNRWENGRSMPTLSAMSTVMEFFEEQGYDRQVIFREWMEEKKKQGRPK